MSSPVVKDPPPLVLKARAPTMPCLASWLSGVAALHFSFLYVSAADLSVDAIFDTLIFQFLVLYRCKA